MDHPKWQCRYFTLAELGVRVASPVFKNCQVAKSSSSVPAIGRDFDSSRLLCALGDFVVKSPAVRFDSYSNTLSESERRLFSGSLALPKEWLSEEERRQVWRFRSPERRSTWIAGRIAAKRILIENRLVTDVDATQITVITRDHRGAGVAPTIRVRGNVVRLSLSLSHTERGVLVGVSRKDEISVGVDLVVPTSVGNGFRRLWFTERERTMMLRPCGRVTPILLWAAKEAAYKAIADGQPFSPQRMEIQRDKSGAMMCRANRQKSGLECRIHNWVVDGQIATVAVCNHTAASQGLRPLEMCG